MTNKCPKCGTQMLHGHGPEAWCPGCGDPSAVFADVRSKLAAAQAENTRLREIISLLPIDATDPGRRARKTDRYVIVDRDEWQMMLADNRQMRAREAAQATGATP